MHQKLLILFVSIIAISACDSNKTKKGKEQPPAVQNTPGDEATKRVQEFYVAYITEKAREQEDTGAINNLFREYCTSSFAKHPDDIYAHGELEADPIMDAQDFDQGWTKTLTAQKTQADQCQVCYVNVHDNQKHCLNVSVVNVDGKWKIDNVVSSM